MATTEPVRKTEVVDDSQNLQRRTSHSTGSVEDEKRGADPEVVVLERGSEVGGTRKAPSAHSSERLCDCDEVEAAG